MEDRVMLTRQGQDSREAALRRYFAKPPEEPSTAGAVILLVIGGVFLLIAVPRLVADSGSGLGIILLLIGLFCALIGWAFFSNARSDYQAELAKLQPQPSDQQVQQWLVEGIQRLEKHSCCALGLSDDEKDFKVPLVVRTPILTWQQGLDSDDLLWKRGKDQRLHFGTYRMTFLRVTDRHLAAYSCLYDFIRDISIHERTDEFHFCDVVSFSTRETSEAEKAKSKSLPTGQKTSIWQEFVVSVGNGDGLQIALDDGRVREITGEDRFPETGAEEAVAAIRSRLRDTKRKEREAGLAA
jgi:hypothetical protein